MEDQVPLRCPTFLPTLHAAEHARPSRIAPPADTGLRAHVCGGSARCKTWCPPFPPPPSPPSSDHAPGPARTNRRLLTASPAQQRCSSRCFGEGCCAGRLPAELLPDGIGAGAVAAREAVVRSNHSPDNPDPQGVQPRSGSDRHGRGFANRWWSAPAAPSCRGSRFDSSCRAPRHWGTPLLLRGVGLALSTLAASPPPPSPTPTPRRRDAAASSPADAADADVVAPAVTVTVATLYPSTPPTPTPLPGHR